MLISNEVLSRSVVMPHFQLKDMFFKVVPMHGKTCTLVRTLEVRYWFSPIRGCLIQWLLYMELNIEKIIITVIKDGLITEAILILIYNETLTPYQTLQIHETCWSSLSHS